MFVKNLVRDFYLYTLRGVFVQNVAFSRLLLQITSEFFSFLNQFLNIFSNNKQC